MAANVLNSPRAVGMSDYVVRAFVRLRELLAGHKELAKRPDQLEARIERRLLTQNQAIAGEPHILAFESRFSPAFLPVVRALLLPSPVILTPAINCNMTQWTSA